MHEYIWGSRLISQRNRVLPPARRGVRRARQPGWWPYPSDIPCVLLILAIVLSSGCANVPTDKEFRATSAVLPATAAGINVDGRSRFRHIFCALAEDQGVLTKRRSNSCEALLWRLADEAPSEASGELPPLDSRLQVFVVGGSFSDCFGPASMAFPHVIERLAGEGYPVGTLAIGSRSSADYNARMIAEGLAKAPERPIVLFGYSKGAVDIAHFLVNYPDMAKQVVAVVSVAGPLMGSEIAAYGEWAYDTFFTGSFAGRCDPGDGGVLDSLQSQVRRDWLESHPLPETVRFYTLLAFADREQLA